MTLINISIAPWRPGRMKRNLSIFTHLIQCSDLRKGIYVNVVRLEAADRYRLPSVETAASYSIAGTPVVVLQPHSALPFSYRSIRSSRLSGSLLARKIRQFVGSDSYCLWLNTLTPVECGIAEALGPGADRVVLDCSDDLALIEDPRMYEDAQRRLARLLRVVNDVVCVNEPMANRIDHLSKHVFRNCTTYSSLRIDHPEFRLDPWIPKPKDAVYIGFIGTLQHNRVDADLLKYLFSRFPNYQFLFVGWITDPLKPLIEAYPNAHHLAEVPNRYLGTVVRSFDAGIVPHVDNPRTQANDLLKIIDYNACEVPVVTTPVSGVNTTEYVVAIASTQKAFGDAVQSCVEGRHGLDLVRGALLARDRSWERHVPTLLPLVNARLRETGQREGEGPAPIEVNEASPIST